MSGLQQVGPDLQRHVKNTDIGGEPDSQYPFVLPQGPGPHDVIILLIGETERAKILAESADFPGVDEERVRYVGEMR